MDEKARKEFCRQMNIRYTPPPSIVHAKVERATCQRPGCDNILRGSYRGFCSPACYGLADKPKMARNSGIVTL